MGHHLVFLEDIVSLAFLHERLVVRPVPPALELPRPKHAQRIAAADQRHGERGVRHVLQVAGLVEVLPRGVELPCSALDGQVLLLLVVPVEVLARCATNGFRLFQEHLRVHLVSKGVRGHVELHDGSHDEVEVLGDEQGQPVCGQVKGLLQPDNCGQDR